MTARSEARHSGPAAEQRALRPALWLHILLWAIQALLAAVYLAHGLLFLFPPPDVAAIMNAQLGRPFCILLGVAELLAAAGLILPGVTRMLPWLTSLAAAGARHSWGRTSQPRRPRLHTAGRPWAGRALLT